MSCTALRFLDEVKGANFLVVGSYAANPSGRPQNDIDLICSYDSVVRLAKYIESKMYEKPVCYPINRGKYIVIKSKIFPIIECEVTWPGTSAEYIFNYMKNTTVESNSLYMLASPSVVFTMKMSHRFKKNSTHFLKTREDIMAFRKVGLVTVPDELLEFFKMREAETYDYSHPNLYVKKKDFFKDDVPYKYDHDDIHKAIAIMDKPAYLNYMKENAEVACDKEKFFELPGFIRLLGIYEESVVLALERSLIPYEFKPDPSKMFEYALQKVCTSITSGWFREYSWENYDSVMQFFKSTVDHNGVPIYVSMFQNALKNDKVRKFRYEDDKSPKEEVSTKHEVGYKIPDDYKLVPKEPTSNMCLIAGYMLGITNNQAKTCYEIMVKHTPKV